MSFISCLSSKRTQSCIPPIKETRYSILSLFYTFIHCRPISLPQRFYTPPHETYVIQRLSSLKSEFILTSIMYLKMYNLSYTIHRLIFLFFTDSLFTFQIGDMWFKLAITILGLYTSSAVVLQMQLCHRSQTTRQYFIQKPKRCIRSNASMVKHYLVRVHTPIAMLFLSKYIVVLIYEFSGKLYPLFRWQ